MLIAYGQFKTTVCLICLASCFGQELLQSCERDCYFERFVERRRTWPNYSKTWHLDNNEGSERGENRINFNNRLTTQIRLRISDVGARQVISDVTRHLVQMTDKRRESQLTEQQGLRSMDDSGYQHHNVDSSHRDKTNRRLNDRHQIFSEHNAERGIGGRSDYKKDQYHTNLRQTNSHYVRKSSAQKSQRINEKRHLERRNRYSPLTRIDGHRVFNNDKAKTEEYEIVRRREDQGVNRDHINKRRVIARFDERDINRYSQHLGDEGVSIIREITENRERNNLKEDIGGHSEEKNMELSKSTREFPNHGTQQDFPKYYQINPEKRMFHVREVRDIYRRMNENESESKREATNFLVISRQLDDREGECNNNRENDLRHFDESETKREKCLEIRSEQMQRRTEKKIEQDDRYHYRLLSDSQIIDDKRLQRKYEFGHRHEEHERFSNKRNERFSSRSRILPETRYKNEEERRQLQIMSTSSEYNTTQNDLNTHSVVSREHLTRTAQPSRKKYDRHFENLRQFEDLEIQEDYEYLERRREVILLPPNDRKPSNDIRNLRLIYEKLAHGERVERHLERHEDPKENICESPRQTSRRFSDRESQYDNTKQAQSSRLREEQRMQRCLKQHIKHEEQPYHSRREVKQIDNWEASGDTEKCGYVNGNIFIAERGATPEHTEIYETLPQLDNYNSQYKKSSSVFKDIRETFRNDMMEVADEQELRHTEIHIYQELRGTKQSFIPRQEGKNFNFKEKKYIAVFQRDTYFSLGQGAILAYIILKIYSGKNISKNCLPFHKLREAMEITGF